LDKYCGEPKFVSAIKHMFVHEGWKLYRTGDVESPYAVVMKNKVYLMDEVGLVKSKKGIFSDDWILITV
jgi:hypothetical protein